MDWLRSMEMFAQGMPAHGGAAVDEEEEDFYSESGNANGELGSTSAADVLPEKVNVQKNATKAPIVAQSNPTNAANGQNNNSPTPMILSEEQKERNRRTAEMLRAKLMAKRQGTPIQQQSPASAKDQSPAHTPAKSTSVAPENHPNPEQREEQKQAAIETNGIDDLLAEGKAAAKAEAEVKQRALATESSSSSVKDPQSTTIQRPQNVPPEGAMDTGTAKPGTDPQQHVLNPKISDPYYDDLELWLEMTGYHDTDYRKAKLQPFKERRALEAEAARIQARLDKLNQEELASTQALRNAPAHATKAPDGIPTVHEATVTAKVAPQTPAGPAGINGVKRAHSPEPTQSSKARREDATNGFRIRGANDPPNNRATLPRGRQRSRSPPVGGALARRISYPDSRRPSFGSAGRAPPEREDRDPSLERRQHYYRHDAASPTFTRDRYDHYSGRDDPRTSYGAHSRTSFGTAWVKREDVDTGRVLPQPYQRYRGSAGLDLGRGGVRYFMIKSWNHENVANAMRDGLWATQVKNEHMLTEAFATARHVLLLFSVNKSMAFQGYALMTSAPDPSLPKPPFCAKLNWGTSPAFRLRWLATTPVHFRYVGHLKNTMNVGDDGQPMAVLVGKDGQEISSDAGAGVVTILDEAEEAEAGRNGGVMHLLS